MTTLYSTCVLEPAGFNLPEAKDEAVRSLCHALVSKGCKSLTSVVWDFRYLEPEEGQDFEPFWAWVGVMTGETQ